MVSGNLMLLRSRLENHVISRTGRRIRDFGIELTPESVVLRGMTTTYYVKQLAQHSVLEILPDVELENDIVVR